MKYWVVLVALAGLATGCNRAPAVATDRAPDQRCPTHQVLPTSIPLRDSHWLRIEGDVISKLAPDGEPQWATRIPVPEPFYSVQSMAPNGTIYLRTSEEILALGTDGQWLWQLPVPTLGGTDQSYQPVAMTDSGVVLRTGPNQYRAYSSAGALRWSTEVDLKGGPSEQPLVLPNGRIIVRGLTSLVAISPKDGSVEWNQTRG